MFYLKCIYDKYSKQIKHIKAKSLSLVKKLMSFCSVPMYKMCKEKPYLF